MGSSYPCPLFNIVHEPATPTGKKIAMIKMNKSAIYCDSD